MASTKTSTSKPFKRPKITIIPPRQLFIDLTKDDTKTPSPKHQLSSLSTPNAPSKTPSTKATSSSSIASKLNSPNPSIYPSINAYLNSPISPPPRVPPPPPTQENEPMDITLTLSPITPLDSHYKTPSPPMTSPPILGHPIPFNLLDAHGATCLNKKDEHGITTKNKARLVAQGYSQEERIDYDKTFAPVARMKAISIFLAFATYMNFIVFQMNVKGAFLNEKLKEEVYVKQPPGFESSEFPDYVCKLDKALNGLKQAPRACLMCKILVLSKIITSNSCEKNSQVFSIWKALGGNTRDLGSFGEEMDNTTNLHQHLLRISNQKLETASQITCDAVTTHLKTASQDLQTTSDCTTQPII
ncbi:retrovirus-related pol polyprotein from transposon TNT 1-94 [Tanacetum coccineum]